MGRRPVIHDSLTNSTGEEKEKTARQSLAPPMSAPSRQSKFFAFGNDSLGRLDQIAYTQGVGLRVAVAFERVGTAAGLNQNVRPNNSRLNVDGRDLGNTDADFVLAEPRAFVAD